MYLRRISSIILLLLADLAAFYTALFTAFLIRTYVLPNFIDTIEDLKPFPFEHYIEFWWMPLIYLFVMFISKLYTSRFPFWEEIKEILKSLAISLLLILTIITLSKQTHDISRLMMILFFVSAVLITPIFRIQTKKLLSKVGLYNLKIGVVGQKGIFGVEDLFKKESNLGYEIGGYFYTKGKGKEGRFLDSYKNIKNYKLDGVLIIQSEDLSQIINELQHYVKILMFLPRHDGIAFLNAKIEHLFDSRQFVVNIQNNLSSNLNKLLKRGVDIFLSLLSFPILLPILVFIAVIIRLDSKGNPFFIQERLGEGDSTFYCLKFRTMYLNSDEILKGYLLKNPSQKKAWNLYKKLKFGDPRITRVGRFLRYSSLDELPQILNVLKGDMSFVGPRPYLASEICDMDDKDYIIRIAKPGITGLWQVMGRNNLPFSIRVELDEWYVRNWSLWLDFVILLKTVKVVLFKIGAH